MHVLYGISLTKQSDKVTSKKPRDNHVFSYFFSAERPPKVDFDKIPREITVKAGKNIDIDIPYQGRALTFLFLENLRRDTEPQATDCQFYGLAQRTSIL